MIKWIWLLCIIAGLGCSTMTYERKAQCDLDKFSKCEQVRLTHTTLGMEYKAVDLRAQRKEGEFEATVKIGSASGKDSFDRAIVGLENLLETMKGLRP